MVTVVVVTMPGLGIYESESNVAELDDVDKVEIVALPSMLTNLSVVAQNRKLPKMLPCGEPPGTGRGLEKVFLTLTLMVLPNRKAAVQSVVVWLAPWSPRAVKHCSWSILLNAFSKSTLNRFAAEVPSSILVRIAFHVSKRKC